MGTTLAAKMIVRMYNAKHIDVFMDFVYVQNRKFQQCSLLSFEIHLEC